MNNKEKKKFSTNSKVKIIITAVWLLFIIILASNNKPEFIRRIQGEEFLGILFGIFVLISIISIIVFLICSFAYAVKSGKKAKKQICNRFSLIGHYILKGKLDGIFKERISTDPTTNITKTRLDIKPNKSLRDYRNKNPQIDRIVRYIKKYKKRHEECPTLNEIIYNYELHGDKDNTAKAYFEKIENKYRWMLPVDIVIIYSIGISKFFLGIHNSKPINNLLALLMFLIPIGFFLLYSIFEFIRKHAKNIFIKTIGHTSLDFINQQSPICDIDFDSEHAEERVSSQPNSKEDSLNSSPEEKEFLHKIFLAISATQIAYTSHLSYIAFQNSNNSITSGCSGCSGCGGGCSGCSGCGGCGGCGD